MNVPTSEVATRASSLPPGVLTIFYDQAGDLGDASRRSRRRSMKAASRPRTRLHGGLDVWQANYGSTRMVTGEDAPWGAFLDTASARNGATSGSVREYDVGRLLTDYVLVDLRPATDYAAGHLAGAINLSEPALAEFIATLEREIPVILYSEDGADSDRVTQVLRAQGSYPKSLLGGLAEWRKQHGEFPFSPPPLAAHPRTLRARSNRQRGEDPDGRGALLPPTANASPR
jgi:rhodanese-related sulfurtransferase